MASQDIDIDALIAGDSSRRRWLLVVLALGVLAAALAAFLFLRGGESIVVIEPEEVQVSQGQLTTTLDLSGTAESANAASLSFGVAGEVVAVGVGAGEAVTEGQLLARLETTELELAVANAELALLEAQEKLDDLSGGPEAVARR